MAGPTPTGCPGQRANLLLQVVVKPGGAADVGPWNQDLLLVLQRLRSIIGGSVGMFLEDSVRFPGFPRISRISCNFLNMI